MSRRTAITKGTEVDTFGYTDWGALASAERGTSGNPDAVSKVERAYDGLNRMTRESQSIREGTARNVDYAYDKSSNVLTLTYPGGTEIVTSYDALSRGDVVKKDGSQIADYGYVGPRNTSLTLETGTNDVTLSMAYDGAQGGRLTRMTYAQTGGSGLPDYSYAFDAGSNITRKTFEHRSGDPNEDYSHDGLHRLTRTDFGQRSSTPYEGFTYDDLGNHLTQDHDGTEFAGLFNSANEQTKRDGDDVTWDLRGNLTEDDDGKEYFYDRQNLLTRVEDGSSNRIASYAYDALGRRIEKDVEDAPGIGGQAVTRFYYDGHRMIEETDDGGTPNVERSYVWGATYIDELLLYNDGSDDYFAARHHNFNVVALLDATDGSVVERYDYNPYGQRFVLDDDYSDDADGLSDVGLNIGHQGLTHDPESGLTYNRARMINSTIGGFMQRDHFEYFDGLSAYLYASANPLLWVDPTGLAKTAIGPHGKTLEHVEWNLWRWDNSSQVYQGNWSGWSSHKELSDEKEKAGHIGRVREYTEDDCMCITYDVYQYVMEKAEVRTRTIVEHENWEIWHNKFGGFHLHLSDGYWAMKYGVAYGTGLALAQSSRGVINKLPIPNGVKQWSPFAAMMAIDHVDNRVSDYLDSIDGTGEFTWQLHDSANEHHTLEEKQYRFRQIANDSGVWVPIYQKMVDNRSDCDEFWKLFPAKTTNWEIVKAK
jgi:RHS repeat-associated protein